ncbi:hypothetical protein V6N13_042472 [Hibiscus sabdariffa]
MEKSSENTDQLDKLDESSPGSDEFGLDTRHCEHNAEEDECEWECDHQAEIDDWNRDYYNNSRLFEGDYRCLPLSACNKTHLDVGNKIIMPASALQPILENQIPMPLQFQIRNLSTGKVSHCGVFEFSGH